MKYRLSFILLLLSLAFPAFAQEEATPAPKQPAAVEEAAAPVPLMQGNSAIKEEETAPQDPNMVPPSEEGVGPVEEPTPPAAAGQTGPTPPASDGLVITAPELPAQQLPAEEPATPTTETPAADGDPFWQQPVKGGAIAVLQGLNKITAHTQVLEAPLQTSIYFGNLEITARSCWKSAPNEQPETKVLLEIWEQKPGEDKQRIFYGWMFASSPSVSALEDAVNDITVVDCKKKAAK